MIAVKAGVEKVGTDKYKVQSYHPNADKLTTEQKEGSILVDSIPQRLPAKTGYTQRLVIDTVNETLEWQYFQTTGDQTLDRLEQLEKATGVNNKTATNGIASRLDDLESRIEALEK